MSGTTCCIQQLDLLHMKRDGEQRNRRNRTERGDSEDRECRVVIKGREAGRGQSRERWRKRGEREEAGAGEMRNGVNVWHTDPASSPMMHAAVAAWYFQFKRQDYC